MFCCFFWSAYTGVIDRPDLQDILMDECKKIKPDFIQNGNPVVAYENLEKGKGVKVSLADGEIIEADVLVGSDGIWSAVRNQMYNEGGIKSMSKNKKKRQGCDYSGYTVFAGETILRTDDYYETGYKVYIGPQRYFVTSDVGDGRVQWYAFFALPPGTKKAPSGWAGSTRDNQSDPEENLVEYIKSLHEGWSDEIMTVLDATQPDSVEQRDLYDRAPEFFRSWADGNVVLMGGKYRDTDNMFEDNIDAVSFSYRKRPFFRSFPPLPPSPSFSRCHSCDDAKSWTRWLSSNRGCVRSH
jgi:zeaxanthin epoxidase